MKIFGPIIDHLTMIESVAFKRQLDEPAPAPGIFYCFGCIGNGIETNWYRGKILEPVSEKLGTGKKSWNRYGTNVIPELIFVAKI